MNIVTFISGKGGVGKSLIVSNLGKILSNEGYKVALLDGNLSFGNLEIILNVNSEKTIFDFLKNSGNLEESFTKIDENLYLIPSYSEEQILDTEKDIEKDLVSCVQNLQNFDFVLVDSSSPFLQITQDFMKISDEIVVVTTPEPPSILNSYTTLKIALKYKDNISIVTNMGDNSERLFVFESLQKVLKSNIESDFTIEFLGGVTKDFKVVESINERTLLLDEYPNSVVVNELRLITSKLLEKLGKEPISVEPINGLKSLINRIIDLV